MKHIQLIIVVIFFLSFLLPIVVRLFGRGPRKRDAVLVKYADSRGYTLVNPALAQTLNRSRLGMMKDQSLANSTRASSDIDDIEGLADGTGDWFALSCTLRTKEVTIFNLSVTSSRADSHGSSIPYKVAKIKAPGLPRVSVGRNSIVHTIQNAVEKITHAAKPAIELDARLYPDFSAHFWIRGSDRNEILAFLSPSKIKFLENAKLEGILATNANYLVYFEDGILLTEQDFDSFVAKADTLIANLL